MQFLNLFCFTPWKDHEAELIEGDSHSISLQDQKNLPNFLFSRDNSKCVWNEDIASQQPQSPPLWTHTVHQNNAEFTNDIHLASLFIVIERWCHCIRRNQLVCIWSCLYWVRTDLRPMSGEVGSQPDACVLAGRSINMNSWLNNVFMENRWHQKLQRPLLGRTKNNKDNFLM